ncbi:MAG: hypothetical protein P8X94_14740 [Woeseiaceae bacterium]
MAGVRKPGLGRVSVAVQPLEQLRAERADNVELREMDVAIDEARDD